MRIMIVDDDFLVRTNLKRLLETSEKCRNAGYIIIAEAADGDQALHQIEMTEPDVIVSDIKMVFNCRKKLKGNILRSQ